MRDGPSHLRAVVVSLVLTCLLLPISTGAVATDERLAEEGLTLLALRNDTIDSNQDGDIVAVRWWSF